VASKESRTLGKNGSMRRVCGMRGEVGWCIGGGLRSVRERGWWGHGFGGGRTELLVETLGRILLK
jgi:hypothetical protein